MISLPKDRTTKHNEKMRGGDGIVSITALFEEHIPHVRLLAEITMEPGCSIGQHVHEAEAEVFYVLEGEATVIDDGNTLILHAGEAHLCLDGHTHRLMNKSTQKIRVLAVIPTMAE